MNDLIHPIIISTDILLRFGFNRHGSKDVGEFYAKTYGKNGVAIVYWREEYQRYCYELGKGHDRVMDYVHHFQNLHFNITGDSLIIQD